MKCQDDGCTKDAVGTDVAGTHLCKEHLYFSLYVQRMCNKYLDESGHPELVPDWAREKQN